MKTDVLTADDLRNAWKKVDEASKAAEEDRYKRSLKDRSKLKPFYEVIKGMKMDAELLMFIEVIERLAEGYFLVMPQTMKELSDKELTEKYKLPQEILDNLIPSQYVPVAPTQKPDKHWYRKFEKKY